MIVLWVFYGVDDDASASARLPDALNKCEDLTCHGSVDVATPGLSSTTAQWGPSNMLRSSSSS
eukprot:5901261-Karenia_brevis.AAC.1